MKVRLECQRDLRAGYVSVCKLGVCPKGERARFLSLPSEVFIVFVGVAFVNEISVLFPFDVALAGQY